MPSRSNLPTRRRQVGPLGSRSELIGCPEDKLPIDVVSQDVIRVVKLWERVFDLDPVRLDDAKLVLRRLATKDDEDALRLGETLTRAVGRSKWNSQAIGRWLMRASKYTVSGRAIRASRRGWRLEEV